MSMRTIGKAIMALAAAALVSGGVSAAPPADERLVVERPWARATPPGTTVGAVYLVIDNRSRRSDRLLSAASLRATSVEVHATIRDLDQVRMRRVDPLHVGAGERLVLEPGGLHVMLVGLAAPLREGETVPLTLKFEHAGEVIVRVVVLAPGAVEAMPHAHP